MLPSDPYAGEREAMVRRQIAGRGIIDPRVLDALRAVPRHAFVPPEKACRAYEDHPLEIGSGQTISQPYMVAKMTELLELTPQSRVLEIGTGSGYQAAILAELAGDVVSVERFSHLAETARETLESLEYGNVTVVVGDGSLGWPERAPYDGIIVTAAAPALPPSRRVERRSRRAAAWPTIAAMHRMRNRLHDRHPRTQSRDSRRRPGHAHAQGDRRGEGRTRRAGDTG